jgi:hypothetical protein
LTKYRFKGTFLVILDAANDEEAELKLHQIINNLERIDSQFRGQTVDKGMKLV